jgi:hypothetical protein
MKYLILSAVCLWNLFLPPSGFAQNPTSTLERRIIVVDVVVIDLKNQSTDELETLSRDRTKFNKAIADAKIKIVSSNRIRCLSGEPHTLRVGQRVPISSSGSSQVQYENTGFTLSITARSVENKIIEVKYGIEWSAYVANYRDTHPVFIQRNLSGITKLNPNELTPILDSIQGEQLLKPATSSGQDRPGESTGNFLILFSAKIND